MLHHSAVIRWKNRGPDFLQHHYSREHTWHFDGGATIPASPSPHIVAPPWSNTALIDPEEALIASVSSCHMLWFLSLACDAAFHPENYEDEAEGFMTKNDHQKSWISQIILKPLVVWRSSNIPTPKEVSRLHHLAHLECFIANSLKSEIIVQPRN